MFVFLETEDFQCKDSGFESWNYPASSGSSAFSSAENFACSRLQYNTSLVDRSKEERFKLDVEVGIYYIVSQYMQTIPSGEIVFIL